MTVRFALSILPLFLLLCISCSEEDAPREKEISEHGEFLDDWIYSVHSKEDSPFETAQFKLWVPDDSENLRGLLILLDHYNGNGLYLADNNFWRVYAKNENLGIVAAYFYSTEQKFGYHIANSGSGKALQEAISKLAEKNNLNYISGLPYFMRGYSGGGMFCYSFSGFYPELVGAVVNIRGGGIDPSTAKNHDVPGLLLAGALEPSELHEIFKNVVASNREAGGNWAYAIEPDQNHYGNLLPSDELIIHFFSGVLEKRIDPATNGLKPIPQEIGWLGNNESLEISHFNQYSADKADASWLINEAFALHWKSFQE